MNELDVQQCPPKLIASVAANDSVQHLPQNNCDYATSNLQEVRSPFVVDSIEPTCCDAVKVEAFDLSEKSSSDNTFVMNNGTSFQSSTFSSPRMQPPPRQPPTDSVRNSFESHFPAFPTNNSGLPVVSPRGSPQQYNSNTQQSPIASVKSMLDSPEMLSQMAFFAMTPDDNIEGSFNCQVCGRFYSNLKKLKRHVFNSHRKEKKYVCNICGKRFGYKHILQEHQNLHFGLKPYACSLCNKRFAAKSNLIQHRHRHVANQQQTSSTMCPTFSCTQCDNKFCSEEALRSHEVIAHSPMNLRCVMCGQNFDCVDLYREHYRTAHPEANIDNSAFSKYCQQTTINNRTAAISRPAMLFKRDQQLARVNSGVYQQDNSQRIITDANHVTTKPALAGNQQHLLSAIMTAAAAAVAGTRWPKAEANVRRSPEVDMENRGVSVQSDECSSSTGERACSDMAVQVDCCSQPTDSDSLRMEELLSRYVAQGRLFRCRHCDVFFTERGMYSLHAVLHGDEAPWQCSVCGRKMADRNEFTLHFVNQQHHSA